MKRPARISRMQKRHRTAVSSDGSVFAASNCRLTMLRHTRHTEVRENCVNGVFPVGETCKQKNHEEVPPTNLRVFGAAKQARPNPGIGGKFINIVKGRGLEGIHAVRHLEGKGTRIACDEEGKKGHEKEGVCFIQLQWREKETTYACIGFGRPGRKEHRKGAFLNSSLIGAQNPSNSLQLLRRGKLENRSHRVIQWRELHHVASLQQSLKRPRNNPHSPLRFRGYFR